VGKLQKLIILIVVLWIISKLLSGGLVFNMAKMVALLVALPAYIMAVVLHEVAHGWVAYLFGDDTAYRAGRLTLNPLDHIDVLGLLSLIFFHFGWAKPVPVNFYRLKPRRWGIFWVAAAGPLANIIQAIFWGVFMVLVAKGGVEYSIAYGFMFKYKMGLGRMILFYLGMMAMQINVMLAAFNLIPIPPLDGSRMLAAIFNWEEDVFEMDFAGFFIIILLLSLGILNPVIHILYKLIFMVVLKLTAFFV